MKVAFAGSDETVRLITAEGFRALSRARTASDPTVVLTEVDPRQPRALGDRAAVLLEIPGTQLERFGSPESYRDGRTFEVPVSFADRFPIIATRAGTPAPIAKPREPQAAPGKPEAAPRKPHTTAGKPQATARKPKAMPKGLTVILPGVALLLLLGVMYLVTDGGDEESKEAPRPTAPARGSKPSPPAKAPAVTPERPRRLPPRSRAVGSPTDGRLVAGVALPAEGRDFFTWSIPGARSPNPRFRRHGTAAVIRRVVRTVVGYRRTHPGAPRVGIADLSLPRGGEFGVRYGGTGHVAHRNGTEVDVIYPRRDRKERAPANPGQVDLRLSQALLDRFIEAGAVLVKVDGRLGLRGPRDKIEPAPFHEEHMHVRFPPR